MAELIIEMPWALARCFSFLLTLASARFYNMSSSLSAAPSPSLSGNNTRSPILPAPNYLSLNERLQNLATHKTIVQMHSKLMAHIDVVTPRNSGGGRYGDDLNRTLVPKYTTPSLRFHKWRTAKRNFILRIAIPQLKYGVLPSDADLELLFDFPHEPNTNVKGGHPRWTPGDPPPLSCRQEKNGGLGQQAWFKREQLQSTGGSEYGLAKDPTSVHAR